MTQAQTSFPKWILIVSGIFALLELIVGLTLCFAPESVIENVDLTAKGVDYVVQMWGVRQIALGFIIALAVFKRSVPMLNSAYSFLLIMFLGDLLIGFARSENMMIISGAVMCIISGLLLFAINRRK